MTDVRHDEGTGAVAKPMLTSAASLGISLAPFPSTEFFNALRALMVTHNSSFRRLGLFDATVGVQIGQQVFVLSFDAFDCLAVTKGGDIYTVDFVLEGDVETWRDMFDNIVCHDGADGEHTITALTYKSHGITLRSRDIADRDKFFRFVESLQAFFDLARFLLRSSPPAEE